MRRAWVADLWQDGRMPVDCGLFCADGTGREADCDGAELTWFRLGDPIDMEALRTARPGWSASADVFAEVVLPDGSGRLLSGGGSHGSDGFFARLDARGDLLWLVHLLCNELVEITVDWPLATFTNNCDNSLTVDLSGPDFGPAR
ncbi:hypothetical protein ABZW10_31265 [Kitasatospora sp. NPDC004723]|uniref:hypothetical protein n=1 Tax=Kitasatospora sp. NPDC004723 TaxID=3154288 RepID=UPI0033A782E3